MNESLNLNNHITKKENGKVFQLMWSIVTNDKNFKKDFKLVKERKMQLTV